MKRIIYKVGGFKIKWLNFRFRYRFTNLKFPSNRLDFYFGQHQCGIQLDGFYNKNVPIFCYFKTITFEIKD